MVAEAARLDHIGNACRDAAPHEPVKQAVHQPARCAFQHIPAAECRCQSAHDGAHDRARHRTLHRD